MEKGENDMVKDEVEGVKGNGGRCTKAEGLGVMRLTYFSS